MPHNLDPSELKAAFEKYRSEYRSWRSGGAKGCAGELESVSMPSVASETSSSSKKIEAQSKATEKFRDYSIPHDRSEIVEQHYRLMRSKQTVAFVEKMHAKYSFENGRYRTLMTIKECFEKLDDYVDSSDPDLGLPNVLHGLQTAEAIRKAGQPDWLVLTGLIHDLGKIMFLWGTPEDGQEGTATGDQWALGGDTFVVGCALPDQPNTKGVTFPEFSKLNPDMQNPKYNTKFGIYEPHCGIDNLLFAYGHDEYLYQMLKNNPQVSLPKPALDIVRFHSAYPWHTARIYDHFMTDDDHTTLDYVQKFNEFDLYTKDEDNAIDFQEVWPYYQGLIDKYCPGTLKW